ncbi:hypothetical protein [Mesorhizobium sp. CA10]|nr:hypothetical protein [Mesorhizobium sp. CA10]
MAATFKNAGMITDLPGNVALHAIFIALPGKSHDRRYQEAA